MRNRIRVMIGLCVVVTALCLSFTSYAAEQLVGKQFYTAINIWQEKGLIDSTNYHKGTMIPLGTKVKISNIDDGTLPNASPLQQAQSMQEPFIQFTGEGGQSYKIVFKRGEAPSGTKIGDLFKQYFSAADPKGEGGAFRALTPEEQESVQDGEIETGMSRTAVIMSYGYPPVSRKTPSLDSDVWVYREGRKTRTVEFTDGKVSDDSGPGKTKKERKKAQRGKKEKKGKKEKSSSISDCIEACKENTNRTPEECFDACNR